MAERLLKSPLCSERMVAMLTLMDIKSKEVNKKIKSLVSDTWTNLFRFHVGLLKTGSSNQIINPNEEGLTHSLLFYAHIFL